MWTASAPENAGAPAGFPRLLGDIGGTRARFALQQSPGAPPTRFAELACADFAGLEGAISGYLESAGRPPVRAGAIGIACPVTDDRVEMTNLRWSFSIERLRQALGWERLRVINDFAALALALPALAPDDMRQVGGGTPVAAAPRALLGPGTGLGVAGLLELREPAGTSRWIAVDGEGGHVTLAPDLGRERETAALAALHRRFGHVSAERALSGAGLVNLYMALSEIDGMSSSDAPSPPQLVALALEARAARVGTGPPPAADEDAAARAIEAVDLFFALLGSVAGDLALTLGARGGVFIGGGVVPRLGDWIDHSAFRARFEAKGRFGDYLRRIPTYLLRADIAAPALLGAAQALD